jgi:hypothetical protein
MGTFGGTTCVASFCPLGGGTAKNGFPPPAIFANGFLLPTCFALCNAVGNQITARVSGVTGRWHRNRFCGEVYGKTYADRSRATHVAFCKKVKRRRLTKGLRQNPPSSKISDAILRSVVSNPSVKRSYTRAGSWCA